VGRGAEGGPGAAAHSGRAAGHRTGNPSHLRAEGWGRGEQRMVTASARSSCKCSSGAESAGVDFRQREDHWHGCREPHQRRRRSVAHLGDRRRRRSCRELCLVRTSANRRHLACAFARCTRCDRHAKHVLAFHLRRMLADRFYAATAGDLAQASATRRPVRWSTCALVSEPEASASLQGWGGPGPRSPLFGPPVMITAMLAGVPHRRRPSGDLVPECAREQVDDA
jgi:hypothetical protein